jgi:rhodanese-related sulfurtransferase
MSYRILRMIIVLACFWALVYQSELFRAAAQSDTKGGVAFIGAEELKAKLAGNEQLVILDVRSSNAYASSDQKIRGAIHVKLRRLDYRLKFAPLKDVPRDRPVITYCSCPADEASISAARVMLEQGFKNVRALKGGWREWVRVNGQVDKKPRL